MAFECRAPAITASNSQILLLIQAATRTSLGPAGFAQEQLMKTTVSLLTLTAALLTSTFAQADDYHSRLKRFDDLTFAAMGDARDLRWEIHDHFVQSRDYQHLLDEVNEFSNNLRDVQRAIYDERPPAALDRVLDKALARLSVLRTDLINSDFAQIIGGYHHVNGRGGYSFAPTTVHPGRVHFEEAVRLLDHVGATLSTLHDELVGRPIPLPGHGPNVLPLQVPSVNLPLSSKNPKVPVLKTKNGKFVVQFGN